MGLLSISFLSRLSMFQKVIKENEMDIKKTSKVISIKYPERRYNSEISKELELQKKKFEEFVRCGVNDREIKQLIRAQEDYLHRQLLDLINLPSKTEIELISKRVEEFSSHFTEIGRIQDRIPNYFIQQFEERKSILDSAMLFQSSLGVQAALFKGIEGAFINLPIGDIEKSLSEYKNLTINLTEFKPYKRSRYEYMLRTTTAETTNLGIIKLKTIQQTQMQVQSLHGEVKEIKQIVIEDGIKKDEMLEELLDYFRNGGTSTVKIQKIKYNKKTAELILDDKTISIKTDTYQHYLCKILFASKKSIQRVWEIYYIVEALGEDTDSLNGWVRVIYDTVRRLNEKIQLQSGIERFILYDNKTILVNPKYIDLT